MLTIDDPTAIAAATHPVRAAILGALREPSTSAAVARVVGQSRQNVAYHMKELEKAGLVRHLGQRQNGNFLEQTYQAVARSFLISPTSTWGDPAPRAQALADQLSLGQLFSSGERLAADSAALLDRAVFDGEEVPSASVMAEVRFGSEEERAAFLTEYVAAVAELSRKHGARHGRPFRVMAVAYPDPEAR